MEKHLDLIPQPLLQSFMINSQGSILSPIKKTRGPEKCSSLLPAAEGREGWSSFAH